MLLNFTLKNWMSFRDSVTFSMLAGNEKGDDERHGDRIAVLPAHGARVLPIAAIFGANATGKSNFFHALRFVDNMILQGAGIDAPIPVQPFALDSDSADAPTEFSLTVLAADEAVYAYSFAVTRAAVIEEKLARHAGNTGEKTLFHLKNGEFLAKDEALDQEAKLDDVRQSTRNNQLFLRTAVLLNRSAFKPLYDWFAQTLILIAPDAVFGGFDKLPDNPYLHAAINSVLPQLDSGITRLDGVNVPLDIVPFGNSREKARRLDGLAHGASLTVAAGKNCFIVSRKNGELSAQKMVAVHRHANGEETAFPLEMESDGTSRLIDLLPAFIAMAAGNKVILIDEIDHSLHTHLTQALLESFLADCGRDSRSQLLFTTHDAQLIGRYWLRLDEIWMLNRDSAGATSMLSMYDYEGVAEEKDLRGTYLAGKWGGVPTCLNNAPMSAHIPDAAMESAAP